MARTNTNAELFKELDQVGVIRDVSSGASGSVNTATVKGDTTIVLGSGEGTNFAEDDYIRVGTGKTQEVAQIESIAADTLTLVSALAYAHSAAESVVEQEKVQIGDLTDDGISTATEIGRSQVNSATSREFYAMLDEYFKGQTTFSVLNHSLENLLASLGIDEDNVHGSGTSADPSVADETPDDINGVENQSWYFTGTLNNGTAVEVQLWRCSVDGNRSIQYVRGGDGSPIPFTVDYGHRRTLQPAA